MLSLLVNGALLPQPRPYNEVETFVRVTISLAMLFVAISLFILMICCCARQVVHPEEEWIAIYRRQYGTASWESGRAD